MSTIHAIYSNGVFRPIEDVDLPENVEVEFEPRVITTVTNDDETVLYDILSRRFRSGESDVAERHDEHQP